MAPAAPKDLKVTEVHPADGSFTLEFIAPGDDGMAGEVLAYEAAWSDRPITAADWARATPLPRWSLPRAVPAGRRQRMLVKPTSAVTFSSAWRSALAGTASARYRTAHAIALVLMTLPFDSRCPPASRPDRPRQRW